MKEYLVNYKVWNINKSVGTIVTDDKIMTVNAFDSKGAIKYVNRMLNNRDLMAHKVINAKEL